MYGECIFCNRRSLCSAFAARYSLDYHQALAYRTASTAPDNLLVQADVYAPTDQYLIDPLREAAKAEFQRQVEKTVDARELYPCSSRRKMMQR